MHKAIWVPIICIAAISCLYVNYNHTNFVGKTKNEIIKYVGNCQRINYMGKERIMIIANNCDHRYFDTIEEIPDDKILNKAKIWGINWKDRLLWGECINLEFDTNDIVIRQEVKRVSASI